MAKSELKCRCFIEIDGAPPVPFESLTQEEHDRVMKIWSERLSRNMSAWFTQHPELYAKAYGAGGSGTVKTVPNGDGIRNGYIRSLRAE